MSKRQSLNGIAESISTDIRKRTKAALEYAGQKISGDFAQMAYLALDHYYSDYTKPPRKYTRTNILMNDSYYKVNKRTGFKINAGITFDPDLMNHPHKGIEEVGILENFMFGIHGNEDIYQSPINYRNEMDNFYIEYHKSNTAYKYFKEYMDR